MTLAQLRAYVLAQLAAPVNVVSKIINVFNAVIDFIIQSDNTGIPAWLSTLTFNTDGTGDGTFCTYVDDDGNLRFWKTKTNGNINNPPPTAVGVTENTYWIEVSPANGSAIKEWTPGVFGDGLIIVGYDAVGDGTDFALFKLTEAVRPYNSTNFATEMAAGKWKRITAPYVTRTQIVTSSAIVTPNADTTDYVKITAQAVNLTLANPTGTPHEGQVLVIEVKDNGTTRTITYGIQYRNFIVPPSATTASKKVLLILKYDSADVKWDIIATKPEA